MRQGRGCTWRPSNCQHRGPMETPAVTAVSCWACLIRSMQLLRGCTVATAAAGLDSMSLTLICTVVHGACVTVWADTDKTWDSLSGM